MQIQASQIDFNSNRNYLNFSQTKQTSIDLRQDEASKLSVSDNSEKDYVDQINEQLESDNKLSMANRSEATLTSLQTMVENMRQAQKTATASPLKFEDDPMIATLRKILDALNEMRDGKKKKNTADISCRINHSSYNMASFSLSSLTRSSNANVLDLTTGAKSAFPGVSSSLFTKTTATVVSVTEAESTSFTGVGTVLTSDGREINFNVELNMSRAFTAKYQSFEQSDYIKTDPLIFSASESLSEVSDQKFYFDLDADGKTEKISFATGNSGFLALDKNGDGRINDGSELFGTKSGDGFKDLSAYDEDNNGWIDENDSVFDDLKIFSKDSAGNDKIISIKDFGVGAIYLGNADTQFDIKDNSNNTLGTVRKTGIYLKENGGVGTVQHVDLVL